MLSIIACAHNRLPLFERHLQALAADDDARLVEYCLAVWGPVDGHMEVLQRFAGAFGRVEVTPVLTDVWWPLPIAYNAALARATCDRVLVVGSDVTVPRGLLEWAATRPTDEHVGWCFRVQNSDGRQFVGPTRKVAVPYCMALARSNLEAAGGWDEAFCQGTCYDDNDVAARLLLAGVHFRWRDGEPCVHQAHPRYGGAERAERNAVNRAVWLSRLKGYDGSLWPIHWDDENPPAMPEGDGWEQQDALRDALKAKGYPWRGSCRLRGGRAAKVREPAK